MKLAITKMDGQSGATTIHTSALLITITILSCAFVIWPASLKSQTPAKGNAAQVASDAHSSPAEPSLATIPFELYGNQIFVRVRVNNSEPLWFVVDSGAGGWIVDHAHAIQLGLHLEQETAQGTGAGSGTYDVSYVKDVTFSLSEFKIPVPLIGVIDLSNNKSQVGRAIEGLVTTLMYVRSASGGYSCPKSMTNS